MKRPLKNRRPIGPLFSTDSDNTDVEESVDDSNTNEVSADDNPVLKQAEDWWEGISNEENKRKMMANYLRSMTDLPDSEIEQMLDEAGL